MSEFDGKKFYGYSLVNDPALVTTTRNFEFRYTRPEQLERAIQRVQATDDPTLKRKQNDLMAKFCTVKVAESTAPTVKHMKTAVTLHQSRDCDIETHIMGVPETCRSHTISPRETQKIVHPKITQISPRKDAKSDKSPKSVKSSTLSEISNHLNDEHPLKASESDGKSTFRSVEVSEYRQIEPKWVEIVERPQPETAIMQQVIRQKERYYAAGDALHDHMNHVLGYSKGIAKRKKGPTVPLQSQQTTYYDYIDDSDLESEMKNRPNYLNTYPARPTDELAINLPTDSDDAEIPKFIVVEPEKPGKSWSFLKSNAPIRYTDKTEESNDEVTLTDNTPTAMGNMKVIITKALEKSNPPATAISKKSSSTQRSKTARDKTFTVQKTKPAISKGKPYETPAPISASAKQAKRLEYMPPPSSKPNTPRGNVQRTASKRHEFLETPPPKTYAYPQYNYTYSPRLPRQRSGTATKSIDDLKIEKLSIFSKMTTNQECIVEILDKLRISLVDVYVPDSQYDRSKRQKNAFEFSVRLSRNYLYPLKGMIEDLKEIPEEQLNSASSNDASIRVAAIFSLILQSLHTYYKQLRFFLLDQVPQKLTTLLEMLQTATIICLDKGIFDKNDVVIDCLLERCIKLTDFLENLHEERFINAQEQYKKTNHEKMVEPRYDLKMFMNNLNMYEPKLVPRGLSRRPRKQTQLPSNSALSYMNLPDCLQQAMSTQQVTRGLNEDIISTQIQERGSSEGLTDLQTVVTKATINMEAMPLDQLQRPSEQQIIGSELDKAILLALRRVTKDQVREVLQPIIESLGSILDKKKNSEVVEAILSAFQMKMNSPDDKAAGKVEHVAGSTTRTVRDDSDNIGGCNSRDNGTRHAEHASRAFKATKRTDSLRQRIQRSPTVAAAARPHGSRRVSYGGESGAGGGRVDGGGGDGGGDCDSYVTADSEADSFDDDNNTDAVVGDGGCFYTDGDDDYGGGGGGGRGGGGGADGSGFDDEVNSSDLRLTCGFIGRPVGIECNVDSSATERSDYEDVTSNGPPLPSATTAAASAAMRPKKVTSQARGQELATVWYSNNLTHNASSGEPLARQPPQTTANSSISRQSSQVGPNKITNKQSSQAVRPRPVGLLRSGPVIGSIAAMRCNKAAARDAMPRPTTSSRHLRLLKKRHNPLSPPPPAPTGTPMSSARMCGNAAIAAALEKPKHGKAAGGGDGGAANAGSFKEQLLARALNLNLTDSAAAGRPKNPPTSAEVPLTQPVGHKLHSNRSVPLYTHLSPYDTPRGTKCPKKQNSSRNPGSSRIEKVLQRGAVADGPEKYATKKETVAELIRPPEQKKKPDLKNIDNLLKERNAFLESCRSNRFYTNSNYEEPWKVFTIISEKLVNEIVSSVEEDFSVGVNKFVKDFLAQETKT